MFNKNDTSELEYKLIRYYLEMSCNNFDDFFKHLHKYQLKDSYNSQHYYNGLHVCCRLVKDYKIEPLSAIHFVKYYYQEYSDEILYGG